VSLTQAEEATGVLVTELRETFGERLESVTLYGSVPRHESVLGISDINVLVILDEVILDDLRRISPIARHCVELGRSEPRLFGAEEFRRSADAFAIEMADLLEQRQVLYGRDPVAGVEVPRGALRHQLEHEIRARHIQLRAGLMVAAPLPAVVGGLLEDALPAHVCYLRAVLRLAGRSVPVSSEDVIRAACNVVGARPDAFLDAWGARKAGSTLVVAIDDPLVAGYLEIIECAIAWVDGQGSDRAPDRSPVAGD